MSDVTQNRAEEMILMPKRLTAENGAKAALSGEFKVLGGEYQCPECEGDGLGPACPHAEGESTCEVCQGAGTVRDEVAVPWDVIKPIYAAAVDLLGKPGPEDIAEKVGARIAQYVMVCIEFRNEDTAQGACRVAEFLDEILPGTKAAYIEEMKKCPT